jgi:hypothetical protein
MAAAIKLETKSVKQEVYGTVARPPSVFPAVTHFALESTTKKKPEVL